MCFCDISVKPEKLCPASLVTCSGPSRHFISDMSDVNVIKEAQTEKGSLALRACWPHNSPIRCVSDDMRMWQKANG